LKRELPPLVTLQEDIDTMARIRQETNDARRDNLSLSKFNSVLMPAMEGLQRKVYGQPAA